MTEPRAADVARSRSGWLERFGACCRTVAADLSKFFAIGRPRGYLLRHLLAFQILFTGVESLAITLAIAVLTGAFTAGMLGYVLPLIGAAQYMGTVFVIVIVREIAPLVTSLIIIIRSASAVCIELGYMKIYDEVSALRMMSIAPQIYIVIPRLFGALISALCLVVLFCFGSAVGGCLIASLLSRVDFAGFVSQVLDAIGPADAALCLVKAGATAMAVIAIACWRGLRVRRSTTEIPVAVSKALVHALLLAFVANALLSALFYMFV